MKNFLLRKFLFRPTRLAPEAHYHFDAPFEELWLDTPDGVRLNALYFPAPVQPARGAVLYFHGNRHNLRRWGAMHHSFTDLGYDVLMPDYRGYGKSGGEPGEAALFADARLLFDWLSTRHAPQRIVVYGRSLGSGMASWLAAQVPARAVVLETPFDSIAGLLTAHLGLGRAPFEPQPRFSNDAYLRQAPMPLLLFHGTRDRVVPYACAARLQAALKPGDEFVTIEGGSHHNLSEYAEYRERLRGWLERVG
ncbi:MAG TPA: alpha/beta fold hydrolase [Saprospiraceae bacterium]|nr:alpha/beta fold hydrolase [Saprospiraceae bacterium]